jgi:DNA polymerase-3 subunit epsilon
MFDRFEHLTLSRPLAILDLETTGVRPGRDRIVEIAILRIEPNGKSTEYTSRINPEIPISAGATAIHGISDADVADCRTFQQVRRGISQLLRGCDLAGFNLKRFDLPILAGEFTRVGLWFSVRDRAVIDVLELYHVHEPRNLASAVRHYLGRDHHQAHAAMADVKATAAILDAQLDRYRDLPRETSQLHDQFASVDIGRRFRREEGQIVFAFGKHEGRYLDEVAQIDPLYLQWMLRGDFLDDAKALAEQALDASTDTSSL